jgi:hypothetical protein
MHHSFHGTTVVITRLDGLQKSSVVHEDLKGPKGLNGTLRVLHEDLNGQSGVKNVLQSVH